MSAWRLRSTVAGETASHSFRASTECAKLERELLKYQTFGAC